MRVALRPGSGRRARLLLAHDRVELRAGEEGAGGEVQVGQEQEDGGERPEDRAVAGHVIDIEGERERHCDPGQDAQDRAERHPGIGFGLGCREAKQQPD